MRPFLCLYTCFYNLPMQTSKFSQLLSYVSRTVQTCFCCVCETAESDGQRQSSRERNQLITEPSLKRTTDPRGTSAEKSNQRPPVHLGVPLSLAHIQTAFCSSSTSAPPPSVALWLTGEIKPPLNSICLLKERSKLKHCYFRPSCWVSGKVRAGGGTSLNE